MSLVYTDHREFADRMLGDAGKWDSILPGRIDTSDRMLIESLLKPDDILAAESGRNPFGEAMFITAESERSQYDKMIGFLRDGISFGDGTVCLADCGSRFHGLRERPWSALAGNIHLVVQFAPNKKIEHYGVGFTILAAVSVVQAIDSIEDLKGRAQTKWVNDIIVDGGKICGVLTYTQAEGDIVTGGVIGIGLNVEATPEIEPTLFVPKAVSIRDLIGEDQSVSQGKMFRDLLKCLKRNYDLLIAGDYRELLDFYRSRSSILGKMVQIYPDSPFDHSGEIVSGKVTGIGENLELFLEGREAAVTWGRLAFKS